MGNQHSESQQGYVEDSRFGLIKLQPIPPQLSQQNSGEDDQLMVLSGQSIPSNDYERWLSKLIYYKKLKEILFLPFHTKIVQKTYCGSHSILQLKYPVYRILLREEVLNRYKIDKPYEEAQIWYLLFILVTLGKDFEKIGTKIGDIHPNNIILNEKGWIKVIGQVSLPKETDNFTKVCDSQINDVFLAPQEIDADCFSRYKYPPGVNPNTAELFSIGMTILEVGTLELSTYIYDKGPYRLNFQKLRKNMQIFRSTYSQRLSNLVETMLSPKPSGRRSCKSIYNSLKQYENQILNLETFPRKSMPKNVNYNQFHNNSSSMPSMAQTKLPQTNTLAPNPQTSHQQIIPSFQKNESNYSFHP